MDAAQGVEAQTVANVHLAHKQGLTIVPVINKIDLPNADVAVGPSAVGGNSRHSLRRSDRGQREDGDRHRRNSRSDRASNSRRREKPPDEILRALVFDSVFDVYRGVVGYVRVVSGKMEADQAIKLMNNDARYEVKEVGVFTPKMYPQARLNAGDVGYFIANIKSTRRAQNRRHGYRSAQPSERTAAGLSGNSSDGFQRNLSDQYRRLRASQDRHRKTAA